MLGTIVISIGRGTGKRYGWRGQVSWIGAPVATVYWRDGRITRHRFDNWTQLLCSFLPVSSYKLRVR